MQSFYYNGSIKDPDQYSLYDCQFLVIPNPAVEAAEYNLFVQP
jgi:hypothetical protein